MKICVCFGKQTGTINKQTGVIEKQTGVIEKQTGVIEKQTGVIKKQTAGKCSVVAVWDAVRIYIYVVRSMQHVSCIATRCCSCSSIAAAAQRRAAV